jgi:hypothetical protein
VTVVSLVSIGSDVEDGSFPEPVLSVAVALVLIVVLDTVDVLGDDVPEVLSAASVAAPGGSEGLKQPTHTDAPSSRPTRARRTSVELEESEEPRDAPAKVMAVA